MLSSLSARVFLYALRGHFIFAIIKIAFCRLSTFNCSTTKNDGRTQSLRLDYNDLQPSANVERRAAASTRSSLSSKRLARAELRARRRHVRRHAAAARHKQQRRRRLQRASIQRRRRRLVVVAGERHTRRLSCFSSAAQSSPQRVPTLVEAEKLKTRNNEARSSRRRLCKTQISATIVSTRRADSRRCRRRALYVSRLPRARCLVCSSIADAAATQKLSFVCLFLPTATICTCKT